MLGRHCQCIIIIDQCKTISLIESVYKRHASLLAMLISIQQLLIDNSQEHFLGLSASPTKNNNMELNASQNSKL